MGFRDILEIYRLLQGHIRDLYVYLSKEKNSQPTRLQPIFWGVVGTVTWLLGWFWNIFWGWLVDQPFSRREFFSHWTVICNQLAWRTATWDGSKTACVRAPASSTRNLESGNLFFLTKIWPSRIYLHTCNNSQCATLPGWVFSWTIFSLWVTWSFALRASPRDFWWNFCPSTLQPANWTRKIELTVLHLMERSRTAKKLDLDAFCQVGFNMMPFLFQVDRRELWWSYATAFHMSHSEWSRLYPLDLAAESKNPKPISWTKALSQGKVILWHGNVKAFHISWTLHGKICI